MNLAGLTGMYWFSMAVTSFQAVYLQNQGFSASQLGLLNALGSAVAIVAVSFWGMVSDRIQSPKKVMITVLVLGIGLYGLMPLVPIGRPYTPLLFLSILPALNLFRGAMNNSIDNLMVRNCNELRLNFGAIRSFGSLLYTVSGLLISLVVPAIIPIQYIFPLSTALAVPCILCACFAREPSARPVEKDASGKKEKLDVSSLFRNGKYVAFLVFTLIFYMACSCEGTFIPYFMRSAGADPNKYSVLLAYRALFEIPFLILFVKLRKRFPLKTLIMVGAGLMGVECFCLSLFANSFWTILLFCTFFGLGNGLFIGAALNYVYELAPDKLKASAQAFFVAVQSIAGICGNLMGGVLFDSLGAKPFYLLIFALYVISILIFAGSSILFSKKRLLKSA